MNAWRWCSTHQLLRQSPWIGIPSVHTLITRRTLFFLQLVRTSLCLSRSERSRQTAHYSNPINAVYLYSNGSASLSQWLEAETKSFSAAAAAAVVLVVYWSIQLTAKMLARSISLIFFIIYFFLYLLQFVCSRSGSGTFHTKLIHTELKLRFVHTLFTLSLYITYAPRPIGLEKFNRP